MTNPTLTNQYGNKFWFHKDRLHRLDGPALVYSSGKYEWHYKGIQYNPKDEMDVVSVEILNNSGHTRHHHTDTAYTDYNLNGDMLYRRVGDMVEKVLYEDGRVIKYMIRFENKTFEYCFDGMIEEYINYDEQFGFLKQTFMFKLMGI